MFYGGGKMSKTVLYKRKLYKKKDDEEIKKINYRLDYITRLINNIINTINNRL